MLNPGLIINFNHKRVDRSLEICAHSVPFRILCLGQCSDFRGRPHIISLGRDMTASTSRNSGLCNSYDRHHSGGHIGVRALPGLMQEDRNV